MNDGFDTPMSRQSFIMREINKEKTQRLSHVHSIHVFRFSFLFPSKQIEQEKARSIEIPFSFHLHIITRSKAGEKRDKRCNRTIIQHARISIQLENELSLLI